MPRPTKTTVDYFPHNCAGGKTMYIIENQFGNDGYSCWFKILELLGSTENHYYDCRSTDAMEYMLAKTRLNEGLCMQILDKLSKLNAIDPVFWERKVIYSTNFVNNLVDLYDRRKYKCPHKHDLFIQLFDIDYISAYNNSINDNINPHSKGEYSIVKDSKGNPINVDMIDIEHEEQIKRGIKPNGVNGHQKVTPDFEWEDEKRKFISDNGWHEVIQKSYKIDESTFKALASKFLKKIERAQDYQPLKELKKYFCNWYDKILENQKMA